eukprot:UN29376
MVMRISKNTTIARKHWITRFKNNQKYGMEVQRVFVNFENGTDVTENRG